MARQKQRLWDFHQKKKSPGISPQTTEKILMVVTAVVLGGFALYFSAKLISILLD